MRRRPPLFALMLAAFALVIVLGVCGMAGMMGLAFGHQFAAERAEEPTRIDKIPGSGVDFPSGPVYTSNPGVDGGDIARGVVSGGLLVATREPDALVAALAAKGVAGHVVGRVVDGPPGAISVSE